MTRRLAAVILLSLASTPAALAQSPPPSAVPAIPDILAASPKSDWRTIDPDRTVYMDLAGGRVIIELAPGFAPNHVANLKTLIRERYFDGLSVIRVQDNFVAQWGDPEEGLKAKALGSAKATLAAEFTRPNVNGVSYSALPDRDAYADEVGFADGMPAGRDPKTGQTWLAHCYATVAVARDDGADTGNAAQLYAVIGQAPRQLDRNMTTIGRVVEGIELLSALPRGPGGMGFYEDAKARAAIKSVRLASELAAAERKPLEALRTDSATFATITEMRRNRRETFYKVPAGHIDLCNVTLPVRQAIP